MTEEELCDTPKHFVFLPPLQTVESLRLELLECLQDRLLVWNQYMDLRINDSTWSRESDGTINIALSLSLKYPKNNK